MEPAKEPEPERPPTAAGVAVAGAAAGGNVDQVVSPCASAAAGTESSEEGMTSSEDDAAAVKRPAECGGSCGGVAAAGKDSGCGDPAAEASPPCVEKVGPPSDVKPGRRGWRGGVRGRLRGVMHRMRPGGAGDGGDLLMDDGPMRPAGVSSAAAGAGGAPGDGAAGPDGVFDGGPAEAWQVVDREGVVLAEEVALVEDPFAKRSVEAKISQLLTWMLAPAVHGIPKLGVPGAVDRADELLAQTGRDVEAAVREVVSGSECTVPLLVLNFCLERIPVVGCPTVLLRTTWGNLRSILIVAALYGHDLEAPRVQHEALLCLVPPGGDAEAAALHRRCAGGGVAPSLLVSETAERVARMMIRGAFRRATGLQAAVDCFELASLLYTTCGQDAMDEDGFVHMTATPASAARDLFRRKSLASCALLWCSLPLLALGMSAPALFNVARWVPVLVRAARGFADRLPRCCRDSAPALVLALLGLAISVRTFRRLAGQTRARRRKGFRLWVSRLGQRHEARALQEAWPKVLTGLVFTVHALLPAASTYAAVSVILQAVQGQAYPTPDGWCLLHRAANTVLGLYSLGCVLVFHLHGGSADERYEATAIDRVIRFLHLGVAFTRGCCVLVAWTYASVALDFGMSRALVAARPLMAGIVEVGVAEAAGDVATTSPPTALGVVGPLAWLLGADRTANPLCSVEALAFLLNVVSVASQQRLVELLSRREVLLRLIGAEKMMASTLCLLLKGVSVACSTSRSSNPIGEFVTSVAPPPLCCVLIVMAREQAIPIGAALVLTPQIISSGFLGSAPSFVLGTFAGVYAAHAFLVLWYTNLQDLESPALRLAILVPGGVSSRAKILLRGALVGPRARAVQMMAMGLVERIARWVYGPRA